MFRKLSFIVVVVFTSGIMGSCGNQNKNELPAEKTTEHASAVNTTAAYICPMNCENSASMVAGVCPVCGMDLVANPDYKRAEMDTTASPGAIDTANSGTHEGHNH